MNMLAKLRLRVRAMLVPVLLAAAAAGTWAGPLQVSVLDKDGKPVIDAVVVLAPSAPGSPKPLPVQALINQEKMRFLPPVTLVAVGARGTFVNNDPWEHHVRGTAAGILQFTEAAAGGFELRLEGKVEGKQARQADVTFDKAGPILLGCHLHASMRAHVYVSDTPWAAVTGAEGTANFDAVPDGAVQVKVWHADQLIDLPAQRVTVGAGGARATMQLSVVPRRRRI